MSISQQFIVVVKKKKLISFGLTLLETGLYRKQMVNLEKIVIVKLGLNGL